MPRSGEAINRRSIPDFAVQLAPALHARIIRFARCEMARAGTRRSHLGDFCGPFTSQPFTLKLRDLDINSMNLDLSGAFSELPQTCSALRFNQVPLAL